jgi:hypothetical protein
MQGCGQRQLAGYDPLRRTPAGPWCGILDGLSGFRRDRYGISLFAFEDVRDLDVDQVRVVVLNQPLGDKLSGGVKVVGHAFFLSFESKFFSQLLRVRPWLMVVVLQAALQVIGDLFFDAVVVDVSAGRLVAIGTSTRVSTYHLRAFFKIRPAFEQGNPQVISFQSVPLMMLKIWLVETPNSADSLRADSPVSSRRSLIAITVSDEILFLY